MGGENQNPKEYHCPNDAQLAWSQGSDGACETTFDGKASWPNYRKQFEAAARVNFWILKEKAVASTAVLRDDAMDVS